jgi:hypothetical protein
LTRAAPAWLIVAAYQAAWFAAILGGARGLSWPGALGALLVLALTLAPAPGRTRRAAFVIAFALLGAAADCGLSSMGWIQFPAADCQIGALPCWMAALWLAFAPCMLLLARWLAPRPLLALALGALGGPLAYLGAQALGAAEISAAGWAAVAAEYALLMLLGARVADRLELSRA